MVGRYWVETLGCPKNQVDSDKLVGTIEADGFLPADRPEHADLVVVNTCAFIESARQESIDTVLDLSARRPVGGRVVVTGCMAERYGSELADALPEVDLVAGFGVAVTLGVKPGRRGVGGVASGIAQRVAPPVPSFDLLNLPRPPAAAPWAYVKVAEGCDRRCGFCAIPSFRGRQRSRALPDILAEVDTLDVREVVLVAQDLASYGRDVGRKGAILELVAKVSARVDRTRLLYLYPSELTDGLIEVMGATRCHYFDLSLQHASRPHLRRMRRWGDAARFAERIGRIRSMYPDAALRSSFIVGYPGETEEDHEALLRFLEEVELDWCGLFAFSAEDGTYAAGVGDQVPESLMGERLAECSELADRISARARNALVGQRIEVLVDEPGIGRSHREAPEIDGVVHIPRELPVHGFADVAVTEAIGPDLYATVED
jgi:ribosomal protein S12 methylthiotransferase